MVVESSIGLNCFVKIVSCMIAIGTVANVRFCKSLIKVESFAMEQIIGIASAET